MKGKALGKVMISHPQSNFFSSLASVVVLFYFRDTEALEITRDAGIPQTMPKFS